MKQNMQTMNGQLMHRCEVAQTPLGRWRLGLRGRVRRQAWRWSVAGGQVLKRGFDVAFSFMALVLLIPLFLLIALIIRMEDGGPVFFTQKRVGRFGREFKMYKFRSMCLDAEARLEELLARNRHGDGVTFKIQDDPRLTRAGKWLRKFSFDELPQFYNVLKGDMALVGPRPPVPREVARYSLADRRRLLVKPGITCFWQVSGRSQIDFSGQVKLDVHYIETQRFWLDVQILARTVPAVLAADGAC